MKTAVVIPARLGATRLPRKPLRELGGEPLVVQVWRRVTRMGVGDTVVVATDDAAIAAAVRAAGGDVAITSEQCRSGTERVAEVAALPQFRDYDAFVNVQGDEPFVSPAFVRAAAEVVASGGFTLGTAAARADARIFERSSVVKVVVGADGRALYFSRAAIPFLREAADADVRASLALQHVGVYAYTRAALERWIALPVHPLEIVERLEQLRPIAYGIDFGVAVVNAPAASGIDTEEDLHDANARWSAFVAEDQSWQ